MEKYTIKWSGLAINGLVALVIGVIFIFVPHTFTLAIIKGLGIILGISGLSMLFVTFFRKQNKGAINFYFVLQGILNFALGTIMFFKPNLIVDSIMLVIGLWALAIGFLQIIYALRIRKFVGKNIFLIANGIAFIGLGLIMILNPFIVIRTMLTIVGSIVIFLGIILLYFSYMVYKANKINTLKIE